VNIKTDIKAGAGDSTNADIRRTLFARQLALSATGIAPQDTPLPLELLALNRLGIGRPYLESAWALSQKLEIPPFEVLVGAGIISPEVWQTAQDMLAGERQKLAARKLEERYLLRNAILGLRSAMPQYSAATTFTISQLVFIGASTALCLAAFNWDSRLTFTTVILFLTFFYGASMLIRSMLIVDYDDEAPTIHPLVPVSPEHLPTYSILVALYKEANQVSDLCRHLYLLDWPKDKLDIKLICEADDLETIAAIHDEQLPECFHLVIVPAAYPRTKPKALNYALPLAMGDYLVLYDAEDRPSPGQLREAYTHFLSQSDDVACLQAPLRIHNDNQNWLSAMFAIEYQTLFNGILPVLGRWRVPMPLGGTSNHFKTEILRQVGAWDPYNVTEDADLGVRLFREGYRCETLTLPTYEEAPPHLSAWLKQRTRWIKGWMQTILVHSRNPLRFFKELGAMNFLAFHMLLTTIVISVLIHPIFIALTVHQFGNYSGSSTGEFDAFILGLSIFNLVGGYTTYIMLAYVVLNTGKFQLGKSMLLLTSGILGTDIHCRMARTHSYYCEAT